MKMGITINYLSYLLSFLLWSSSVFCHQSSMQKSIMLNLFQLLQNPEIDGNYYAYNPPQWNASTNPCTWEGVICANYSVTQLHLSNYKISDSSVISIACQIQSLEVLDVSQNLLDSIPEQLANCSNLTYLDLSLNELTGTIPADLGLCQQLLSLNLAQNWLSGELPTELGNLKQLQVLNLDANNFVGKIPHEFTQLFNLKHLSIRWTLLSGSIPPSISDLTNLQELHLQGNRLSGLIPPFISNLTNLENLDLSDNELSGLIPKNIGNLHSLIELQLSNNILGGKIPLMPHKIQILDLSSNELSGNIPSQLVSGRLRSLDLSNNRLSGPIPTTLQIYGYPPFAGNTYLCGEPVTISCGIVEGGDISSKQKAESKDFYIGLYVSMGLGFYFGFWGVCGTLALKHTWRYAFFNFIDNVYNRIYVTLAIYISKFQRNSQTC